MKDIKISTYIKTIIFVLLMLVAISYPENLFDIIISNLLQIKSLNTVAKIISLIFHDKILLVLMVLLSAFLVYIKEYRKATFIFFTAGVGGFLLTVIKYTVKRPRPLPELHDGFSFPSGHSLFVALFFLALLYVINKKVIVGTVATFAIILVPISRLIVGAHFLTDVVAGVLLASIIVDLMKIYHVYIYKLIMKFIPSKN